MPTYESFLIRRVIWSWIRSTFVLKLIFHCLRRRFLMTENGDDIHHSTDLSDLFRVESYNYLKNVAEIEAPETNKVIIVFLLYIKIS